LTSSGGFLPIEMASKRMDCKPVEMETGASYACSARKGQARPSAAVN
jgi:hypothetical protein